MSGYSANDDYDDPAKAYFQPLQDFASLLEARARIENNFRAAYEDLVVKYRNKCDEYDRERRNAALWEKEQRMAEKELTNLKSRAVGFLRSHHSFATIQSLGKANVSCNRSL